MTYPLSKLMTKKQLEERITLLESGELEDLMVIAKMSNHIKFLDKTLKETLDASIIGIQSVHETLNAILNHFNLNFNQEGKLYEDKKIQPRTKKKVRRSTKHIRIKK